MSAAEIVLDLFEDEIDALAVELGYEARTEPDDERRRIIAATLRARRMIEPSGLHPAVGWMIRTTVEPARLVTATISDNSGTHQRIYAIGSIGFVERMIRVDGRQRLTGLPLDAFRERLNSFTGIRVSGEAGFTYTMTQTSLTETGSLISEGRYTDAIRRLTNRGVAPEAARHFVASAAARRRSGRLSALSSREPGIYEGEIFEWIDGGANGLWELEEDASGGEARVRVRSTSGQALTAAIHAAIGV